MKLDLVTNASIDDDTMKIESDKNSCQKRS
jgi:hypothetical protein